MYGRRPPKNAPALGFASFVAKAVPTHPSSEDYLKTLTNWQMLGNDRVGDCNAVTWANMRRLVTATLSKEYYPAQAQVWEFYRTQNPQFDPNGTTQGNGPGSGSDQGMDVQTGLEYLHANGGPDGVKAVAFAKVDHTNIDEVDAALAIFGGLWLGIAVLDANQQQFANGQPWSDVPGAKIDGGHAILAGGYVPGREVHHLGPGDRAHLVVLERGCPGDPAGRRSLGGRLARAPRLSGVPARRRPDAAGSGLPGRHRQRAYAVGGRPPDLSGPARTRMTIDTAVSPVAMDDGIEVGQVSRLEGWGLSGDVPVLFRPSVEHVHERRYLGEHDVRDVLGRYRYVSLWREVGSEEPLTDRPLRHPALRHQRNV
jgi:hypothetical protein